MYSLDSVITHESNPLRSFVYFLPLKPASDKPEPFRASSRRPTVHTAPPPFTELFPRDAKACTLVVQAGIDGVQRLEDAGDDVLPAVEEGVGAACIKSQR